MQEKLVIFLSSHESIQPSWVVMQSNDVVSSCVYQGDVAQLTELSQTREVVAVVPGESVLMTTTMLPKLNRTRLMKALPFALEEQLIDDVEALHFAPGAYQSDLSLPSLVVARDKMDAWLAYLATYNVHPRVMLPLTLTLPVAEKTWSVVMDEMAIVRINYHEGFTCDVQNLAAFLAMKIAAVTEKPTYIVIYNTTQSSRQDILTGDLKVEEHRVTHQQLISLLAREAVKIPAINLLQGDYRAKKSGFNRHRKLQKAGLAALVCMLSLFILYPIGSYFILSQRLNNINNQIIAIYKQQFPQATSVVAPRMRMEDKLHSLESNTGMNRLLILMGYVGKALKNAEGVRLTQLDFQGGQLTLNLIATSSEHFSALTDALSQDGIAVSQQNATLDGSKVNATIAIE